MRRPRRNHSAQFKAKVALAALRGDKTLVELSEQFDVHANQIVQWKQQAMENLADAFASALADALASATDNLVTRDYLDAKLAELRVEMHDMKADIIKWMAGLLILQAGVVAALVKLL